VSTIPSVTGPIEVESMGPTLTHEHFFVDVSVWGCRPRTPAEQELWDAPITLDRIGLLRRRSWSNRDNLVLDDHDLLVEELGAYRDLGGRSVLDVTPQTVGRDPVRLRALAEATGVQIVCGTGFYVRDAHPAWVADASEAALAEHMVRELTEGIDDTGIRAGIIGELGTSDPIHPEELRVLRAGAAASRRTGAAITLHLAETARLGHECLDVLEAEGVPLDHVVLGHSDGPAPDLDYLEAVLRRGAYVQFDFFGVTWGNDDLSDHLGHYFPPPTPDDETVRVTAELVRRGYGRQLLLSHDTCTKTQLLRYGGFGYGHTLRTIIPQLRWQGVPEATLDDLAGGNARRLVAWRAPTA
jgi:phosphotriesterase-related protein